MIHRTTPGVVALFAAFAIVWTFPLVTNLSGQLPGPGPGDNLQFLWNFWWMRTAHDVGQSVFHTTYLFVPAGADLTLHTNTALLAFVSAKAFGWLPTIATLNISILVSLFLNGFCTYLLAWRVCGDRGAAVIGGLVFAGSSYFAGHLTGHFNLTTGWTLPLFAIAAFEAMRGSRKWAALAGLALAATVYVDYYYVILESALGLVIAGLAWRDWSVSLRTAVSPARIRIARVVAGLIGLVLLATGAIAITGGFAVTIGGQSISAHSLYNPLQAFWLLVALWLWLRFHPRIAGTPREPAARVLVALAIMGGVFLIGAAPIIRNAVGLMMQGDYVTQKYFWRSAPSGIDLGTLVLGHPFHGLWGGSVRTIYASLGIDDVEGGGWLGIVPVLLAIAAFRTGRTSESVRQWSAIGAIFFVWALGPHLEIFGRSTGMILPQTLLRYVPIVNNARIPSRAMVVVYLSLAVLAALGAARWRPAFTRRPLALTGLAFLLVAEFIPAPFPVAHLVPSHIDEVLRDRPEAGAVCELPVGIHDGFGGRGSFSAEAFFHQTIHHRPLVGGYLSRMPASLLATYANDPLLDGLLRLSESGAGEGPFTPPDRNLAADRLRANGIGFVVLNRQLAPARLIEYVENVLPLEMVERDGERTLYVVRSQRAEVKSQK